MNHCAGHTRLDVSRHLLLILAEPRFVSERPHNDRGMVLVALEHTLNAVEKRFSPILFAGEVIPVADALHTVSFVVGLVANEEAELVAKGVEARIVRVVAGTDHIEVVALEDVKILEHMVGGSGRAEDGMAVVAVSTVNLDLLTVDVNDTVLDLNGAETDELNDVFLTALDNEGVKLGRLVAPESGVGNEHFKRAAAVKGDRAAAFLMSLGSRSL